MYKLFFRALYNTCEDLQFLFYWETQFNFAIELATQFTFQFFYWIDPQDSEFIWKSNNNLILNRGEPANVSRDWLREARVLLETKQACRALVAYAAAVGVEAMPQAGHNSIG